MAYNYTYNTFVHRIRSFDQLIIRSIAPEIAGKKQKIMGSKKVIPTYITPDDIELQTKFIRIKCTERYKRTRNVIIE